MSRARSSVLAAGLLTLLAASPAHSQAPAPPAKAADADAGFIEFLRRQDPAAAERFLVLRDARDAAVKNLQAASARYSAGGTALRAVSLPELREARRRYAEASVALLDFLDERDRATLARLEATAERLKADAARLHESLEERARARADIRKNFGD